MQKVAHSSLPGRDGDCDPESAWVVSVAPGRRVVPVSC